MSPTRVVKFLWNSITEPRHLKVAYAAIYAVVLGTGMATLLHPPRTIEGELGQLLTVIWSAFLLLGGFGGLLTVFPGWWWAERLSIVLTLTGLGIYALVVVSLHFTSSGSRLTQLGTILLAASPFIIRWVLIRKYSFEPRTRG
ncbi:hypothetical protein [Microbacterium album]|uniref:Uncharacterized protein n=1 Tax=Microbacterium album TaxID=2053191 RepID=A0A917IDZ8_9MICO|nr:hypothetical protein [Microbacterium album]GGH34269.1 hypothetical protein GCM10010921_01850 [Microbacterium album]